MSDVFRYVFLKSTQTLYPLLVNFVNLYWDLGFNPDALEIDKDQFYTHLYQFRGRGKPLKIKFVDSVRLHKDSSILENIERTKTFEFDYDWFRFDRRRVSYSFFFD